MTPEQTAEDIILRFIREGGTAPLFVAPQLARKAVEAISAAELLIVPAARLARLLEVERAARALAESEPNMWALLHGTTDEAAAVPDDWPEADALVLALIEVAA